MPYNSDEKEKPTCPICGKPTANMYKKYQRYGLCVEHSKQFNNKEIEKCPDCSKWHSIEQMKFARAKLINMTKSKLKKFHHLGANQPYKLSVQYADKIQKDKKYAKIAFSK